METYADQFAHDTIAQEALRLAHKYHRPAKWAHDLAYYITEMEIHTMPRPHAPKKKPMKPSKKRPMPMPGY